MLPTLGIASSILSSSQPQPSPTDNLMRAQQDLMRATTESQSTMGIDNTNAPSRSTANEIRRSDATPPASTNRSP